MKEEYIKIPVAWLKRLKEIARVEENDEKIPEIFAIGKINRIRGYLESIELPPDNQQP